MKAVTNQIRQVSGRNPRLVSVINILWIALGGMWAVVSAAGPDVTFGQIVTTPGIIIPSVLAGLGAVNAVLSNSLLDRRRSP